MYQNKLFVILISINILNISVWNKVCDNCWCGNNNREHKKSNLTLKDCKKLCENDHQCDAVEFWAGNGNCNICKNPDDNKPYLNSGGYGYPASVHKLGKILKNKY